MNIVNPQSYNPTIIERTPRGEIVSDVFSMLLRNRIIFLGVPIDNHVANVIVAQLLHLSNDDADAPIQMYINSPGGQVYAGLAIYDTMQMITNPVSTVAVGATASFGTMLLTAGAKGQRYALPHATIHMHQPLGGVQGQASDIEIQAREILRLKARLNGLLALHSGQSIETIEKDTNRDFYMDAAAAAEYGLVDQVLEHPAKTV
jgi:ATP-dependent Clp protease protease subunit